MATEIRPDRLAWFMPAFGLAFYAALLAVLLWFSAVK